MHTTSVNLINNYPPPSTDIILQLFQQFRSPNNEQIQEASKQLVFYQENFPGEALAIASNLLLNDDLESYIFKFSAIYINNILSPTLYIKSLSEHISFWRCLDPNIQSSIKQGTFRGLMFSDSAVRNLCAKSVSLIAKLEVPLSRYPDLYDKIFQIILDDQYGEWAKLGGIQAITELLIIHPDFPVIPKEADIVKIGETIFQITFTILQNQQVPDEFKETAANCLRVSLPIFTEIIQNHLEPLLKVILSVLPIGMPAYKLLRKFSKIFYDKLVPHLINFIFEELSKYLLSDDRIQQFLVIDFWYRFSKFELKKFEEIIPGNFYNISNQLSSSLCKPLLQILPIVISESNVSILNEDDDNQSGLIIQCMKQFAKIPQNQEIVATTICSFFQEFISNENPIIRYSTLFSLFSIDFIEKQPQLSNFFISNIPIIIELILNDKAENVRCISTVILGNIIVHQKDFITDEVLQQVISLSTQLLTMPESQISASACKMLSTIFKHANPDFISSIFDTFCHILIQMLDRPDIFTDQFLAILSQTLVTLLKAAPEANMHNIVSYINIYNEIGPRLENAINATFPDQFCKQKMISTLCLITRINCLKIRLIPNDSIEAIFNITSRILDLLIYLVTSLPNMCETEALLTIATMIIRDPAKVIQNRIDQIVKIIFNVYTTSNSPDTIKVAGNGIRDLIYLYPKYMSQIPSPSNPEKSLAKHLFEITIRFFKSILLIDIQIWLLSVAGEILPIIDDPDFAYTCDIINGLNYLKSITKICHETNLYKLQAMMNTSSRLIEGYERYDPSFLFKNKAFLFFAALEVAKNKYNDPTLIKNYLFFLEAVVNLPIPYFAAFAGYVKRAKILESLELPPPFEKKGKELIIRIKKKTK